MVDTQMARIPKTHFSESLELPYDVYVRLGPDHFVLVGRSGRASTLHRLKAFDAELVPWFYVLRDDFPIHLGETVARATNLRDHGAAVRAASGAVGALMELVRLEGFTHDAWVASDRLATRLVEAAVMMPATGSLLAEIGKTGELQMRHAVGVSLIAVLLGQALRLPESDLKILATAGLVHDVGWLRLPGDVIGKSIDALAADELETYKAHAAKGAELLHDCSQVPGDVVTLVREHHGGGKNPDPRSVVLALAERFGELSLGDSMHPSPVASAVAMNVIRNLDGHPYPLAYLDALDGLVKSGRIHSI